jgi:hypothetical protein
MFGVLADIVYAKLMVPPCAMEGTFPDKLLKPLLLANLKPFDVLMIRASSVFMMS